MAGSFEVQRACAAQADAVKRLYDDVVEDNTGSRYDVLWRRDLHPSDDTLDQAIDAGQLYVAQRDGKLVGACVLNDDFAPGYENVPWRCAVPLKESRCLHLFCTHPACAGQGVGTAFLAGLLDCARRQGVRAVRLDVFDFNAPAKHLYEKMGFQLVATTLLQYEDQDVSSMPFDMYEIAL